MYGHWRYVWPYVWPLALCMATGVMYGHNAVLNQTYRLQVERLQAESKSLDQALLKEQERASRLQEDELRARLERDGLQADYQHCSQVLFLNTILSCFW